MPALYRKVQKVLDSRLDCLPTVERTPIDPIPGSHQLSSTALPTPTRRTLVRNAAWTVPIVSMAVAAPSFGASPCATRYDYTISWPTGYVRNSATSGTVTLTGPAGTSSLTMTLASVSVGANVPDPTRNLQVPANTTPPASTILDPVVSNLGGRTGERGVRLHHQTSAGTRDARQELTITFSRPVADLGFWITDIDTITSSPFSDRVELIGRNAAGGVVAYTPGPDGVLGTGAFGDAWRRTADLNVDENSAGAQVRVDFPQTSTTATDVKSMQLTYWNATGGTQYHRIFIGRMTFTARGC